MPKMSSEERDRMMDGVYLAVANATGWKSHHWVDSEIVFEDGISQRGGLHECECVTEWSRRGVMGMRVHETGELQVCFIRQPCTKNRDHAPDRQLPAQCIGNSSHLDPYLHVSTAEEAHGGVKGTSVDLGGGRISDLRKDGLLDAGPTPLPHNCSDIKGRAAAGEILGRAASSTRTMPGGTIDGEGVKDDKEAEVGGGSDTQPMMSSEGQGNMLDIVYRAVAKATGWKSLHWINADLIIEELISQTVGSEVVYLDRQSAFELRIHVAEYVSMWTTLGIMDVRKLDDGEIQVCFVCQPCT